MEAPEEPPGVACLPALVVDAMATWKGATSAKESAPVQEVAEENLSKSIMIRS